MADDERGAEARRFFAELWADEDPWDLESSVRFEILLTRFGKLPP